MKVIDLLQRIANGEEVPKKIKFKNNIYKWIERNDNVFNYKQEYKGRLIDNYLCDDWFMDSESILNDEVEVIEEDKKIEKIDMFDYFTGYDFDNTSIDLRKRLEFNFQTLNNKINEIIDYIIEDKHE